MNGRPVPCFYMSAHFLLSYVGTTGGGGGGMAMAKWLASMAGHLRVQARGKRPPPSARTRKTS